MTDEKQTEKKQNQYTGMGMILGVAIGSSLGQILFGNLAIGAGVGMVLGMAFGSALDSQAEKKDRE